MEPIESHVLLPGQFKNVLQSCGLKEGRREIGREGWAGERLGGWERG